jgi:hypothetical protein
MLRRESQRNGPSFLIPRVGRRDVSCASLLLPCCAPCESNMIPFFRSDL